MTYIYTSGQQCNHCDAHISIHRAAWLVLVCCDCVYGKDDVSGKDVDVYG